MCHFRDKMIRWGSVSLMVSALAVSSGVVKAGGYTACDNPRIFPGNSANVVPIEYLATAADRDSADRERIEQLQATARQLAWLIKLDSWHQPIYGSLGVVAHMFIDRACEPDEVLKGLIRGTSGEPIPTGQVIVVLQGKIFTEGDNIFLQSRLRGFRRNAAPFEVEQSLSSYFENEGITTRVRGDDLEATLPPLDITFAPRALTVAEFEEINDRFEEGSLVRQQPSESSPGTRLLFDGQMHAFNVGILGDGEWILLEEENGIDGYVQANLEVSAFLHRKLPELDFLNGMLGYLRIQQARENIGGFEPPPESAAMQIRSSFGRFLESPASAEDKEARALASALMGVLAAVNDDWPGARQLVSAAVADAPYRSEYRNLLGLVDARLCCDAAPSGEFGDPARAFADSLSLAPENVEALRNLHAFLSVLSQLEAGHAAPEGIDASRLAERQEVVQKVVSAVAPAQ